MQYLPYTLLSYLLLPLGLLRLLWRSRRAPAYRQRVPERLGFYSVPGRQTQKTTVVFHAVSVGEVHAAQPLIEAMLQRHPELNAVVTTSTPTGSARVLALFGERVEHVYLPWDLPGATRRFVAHFRPRLLVLLETELWPVLVRASTREGCRVVLANARLSAKSQAGYQRFAALSRTMLEQFALVAAQSETDGARFVELGLPQAALRINGSLKFDVGINTGQRERALEQKQRWQGRPVWIAASTREGEDEKVLQAFGILHQAMPDCLLLLVPRHPERFRTAGELAVQQGFAVQYAGAGEALRSDTAVLVGDTMGEMSYYYSLADLAFVGGSLVPTGCQNIIEPAALGLPVLTGPSLYNFQKASELLRDAGAMEVVADPAELAARVGALLRDPAALKQMGERARAEVQRNQGATARLVSLLDEVLETGGVAG